MATLTYDPTEAQEGEFSEEEQESIKVGEALEEQQQQLLAGKFKDAEDLENAYIELQKKLGDPSRDKPEAEADTTEPEEKKEEEEKKEVDTTFLDKLWDEATSDEKVSDETMRELEGMSPTDLASMYLDYRSENDKPVAELTEEQSTQLKAVVGGDKEYDSMIEWAKSNLNEQEINMFDEVLGRADPYSCFFAVRTLANRYLDAIGQEGELLTGKPSSNKQNSFRSQAEVVRAMNDPRYEKDPAYRQDIYDKLERSNLNF
jgi:hypothetical protein